MQHKAKVIAIKNSYVYLEQQYTSFVICWRHLEAIYVSVLSVIVTYFAVTNFFFE